MNTQLSEQLRTADSVCTFVYTNYFNKAEQILEQAKDDFFAGKKRMKWISIIGGILFYAVLVLGITNVDDEGVWSLISMGISAVAGILLYRLVLLPKVNNAYYAKDAEASDVDSKGLEYVASHKAELDVIPSEYWYPRATNYISRLADTGRVETINQALQMLDEQIHRWSVEDSNAQIVAEQKAQTKSLRSIAVSSAINAYINSTK